MIVYEWPDNTIKVFTKKVAREETILSFT